MKKKQLILAAGCCLVISVLSVSCASTTPAVATDLVYEVPPAPDPEGDVNAKPLSRQEVIPQLQVDAGYIYRNMLVFLDPEAEENAALLRENTRVCLTYPAHGIAITRSYQENADALTALERGLARLKQTKGGEPPVIRLTGYASPDGNSAENERLSRNRAASFRGYLKDRGLIPASAEVVVDWGGEDWEGLAQLIAASSKAYANKVLPVLKGSLTAAAKLEQLKKMDGGSTYKDMEANFFSKLRRIEVLVDVELPRLSETPDLVELTERFNEFPDKLTLEELLVLAKLYRPGTEGYREVYEIAAYRFPENKIVQLNAAAAALAVGDKESARYFLSHVQDDPRSYASAGVLALMDGDLPGAEGFFKKGISANPRLMRENLRLIDCYK
ncbi:MAG: hypothetical protein PHG27_11955 [Massilibacteroides sp.]|nr:hypothetical protein [Massilibacteroides sp.]